MVRNNEREGNEGEEMVLQCLMVPSKVKLGRVKWRAKTSKAHGNKKNIRNRPICSKVLSITAMESRTELDQQGGVNGAGQGVLASRPTRRAIRIRPAIGLGCGEGRGLSIKGKGVDLMAARGKGGGAMQARRGGQGRAEREGHVFYFIFWAFRRRHVDE